MSTPPDPAARSGTRHLRLPKPGRSDPEARMSLYEHIREGHIDPSFVITHRMKLEDAPVGYDIFTHKEDECMKVVLKPGH